jgi:hypothetical protein
LKGNPAEDLPERRYTFVDYAREWTQDFSGLTRRGIAAQTRGDYAALLGVTTRGELGQPKRGAANFGWIRRRRGTRWIVQPASTSGGSGSSGGDCDGRNAADARPRRQREPA